MIRESISKVKSAVATKDIIPYMTHYYVHEGFIHATNDRITAAAPFPDERTYLVPAVAFQKSLDKMPSDDIEIQLDNARLKIKCGRCRASLDTLPLDGIPIWWRSPDGNELEFPVGLTEKLKAIRPFISDNATQPFALCVCFWEDRIIATNNVSVVAAYDIGFPADLYCMLPVWGVDFLLERDQAPIKILYADNHISFQWLDGSWLRVKTMDVRFPEVAKSVVDNAPQPQWELSPEWKDIYRDVAELATSTIGQETAEIRFYKDRIIGGHKHGEFQVEIETPVPAGAEFSAWNPVYLSPVITAATHFDPTYWPQPCPFVSANVAGAVLGIRR